MATKSWELSNQLWERLKPLIPERPSRDPNKTFQRKSGVGRKPAEQRKTLGGIFYVLRTGCQWNAVPRCYGAGSTVHRYFLQWVEAGFFENAWKAALKEYDELKTIEMHLCADNGYTGIEYKNVIIQHGYIPHLKSRQHESEAKKQVPGNKARRWVVEECHSWLNRFRKILVRFEKTIKAHKALLHFALAIICWRIII